LIQRAGLARVRRT